LRAFLLAVAVACAGVASGVLVGGEATGPGAATAAAPAAARHHAARGRCTRRRVRHHRRCRHKRRHRHDSTAGPGRPDGSPSTGGGSTGGSGGPTGTTTTPTTTGPTPLPSRLAVDENDNPYYTLHPTHNPVAAGSVEFNVYNLGMDDHTFAVDDAGGHHVSKVAQVPANHKDTAVTVTVNLAPGSYTLVCTLSGHAAAGMKAPLTVQ
jgi:plastocyanin